MIKSIRKLVLLEMSRLSYKRNVILFSIFVFFLLIFLVDGIDSQKSNLSNIEKFQKIEAERVRQYVFYTQYGGYGMNILFVPGPMSVLSASFFNDLVSTVNSADRLNIYTPREGKNLFSQIKDFYSSTAGYILLIFGFFSVLFGYEVFRDSEYIKFLGSICSHKLLFLLLYISRVILLIMFVLFISVLFLACSFFKGVNILNPYLPVFLGLLLLVLIFLFSIGFMVGMFRSKSVKLISMILIYFFFFYVLPVAVTKVMEKKAESIKSHYDLYLEKLKLFMTIERDGFKKFGNFKSGKEAPEDVKKFIKDAIHKEFAKLSRFETNMREEISNNVTFFHFLSSLFPNTFYRSCSYELSSNGFLSYLEYYKYTQELKRKFLDFYIEKKFFSDSTPGKVESFVKVKENIFFSKSKLPRKFLFGLLLTLFYTVSLTTISFFLMKKYLFSFSSNQEIDWKVHVGKCKVCLTSSRELKNFVYGFFYREYSSKKFIYICHPDHIPPDIRVNYFLGFVLSLLGKDLPVGFKDSRSFMSLSYKEKLGIIFSLLDYDYKLVIFNEIEYDAFDNLDFLVDQINKIKERTSLLYLTNHIYFASKIYDDDYIIPHPIDNINL